MRAARWDGEDRGHRTLCLFDVTLYRLPARTVSQTDSVPLTDLRRDGGCVRSREQAVTGQRREESGEETRERTGAHPAHRSAPGHRCRVPTWPIGRDGAGGTARRERCGREIVFSLLFLRLRDTDAPYRRVVRGLDSASLDLSPHSHTTAPHWPLRRGARQRSGRPDRRREARDDQASSRLTAHGHAGGTERGGAQSAQSCVLTSFSLAARTTDEKKLDAPTRRELAPRPLALLLVPHSL